MNSKDLFSIETFFNENMLKLSDCEYDEQKQIIRHAPLIALDKVSRNMSMYDGNSIIRSLQSPYVSELFRRGTCFCELEHPDINCSRERFMKVDTDNTCGRIMNYSRENDLLRGDFQFVQPKGYIPLDWFNKGVNFGWSIRILTPNYEERKDSNGNPYVYKHGEMRFISFDVVRIGGFKEASIVSNVDSYDASKENWNGIHASWTDKRKKEEFKRLLEAQETLPIMEDVYGFSMSNVSNISYSEEGLITICIEKTKNHTKAIKIPSNTYKVNQVLMSGV
jgi:hypothetical protein